MFDIGWSEIMVIVMVAIIVVGPKDIPKLLRTVGKFINKAKSMVRDVQSQIEEVADISELKELKAEADNLKNFDMNAPIDQTDFSSNTDVTPNDSAPADKVDEAMMTELPKATSEK